MKKSAILLLLFTFVSLLIFVSCAVSPDTNDFTYEISDPEFIDTNRFLITVTMKNDTGKDYKYHGTYNDMRVTSAKLYCETTDGIYALEHDLLPYSDDAPADHVLKAGEEVKSYFYYDIPKEMAIGEYTFEFTHLGNNVALKKVFTTTELPEKIKEKNDANSSFVSQYEVVEILEKTFICKNEQYDRILAPNWLQDLYELKVGDVVSITHNGKIINDEPAHFQMIYEMSIIDENGDVISMTEDELTYKTTLLLIELHGSSFVGTEQNVQYPSEISAPNWFADKHELKVGDIVHVIHSGGILESYPGQFTDIYEMQLVLPDGNLFIVTEDDLPEKEPYQLGENETLENDMILSYSNDHDFENEDFRYEITDFTSVTNEYFEFAITITNISGEDYEFFGTYNDERVTEAKVYIESDGEEYHFTHEEIALTADEAATHTIKAGEQTKSYFRFELPSTLDEVGAMPAFAAMGSYSLEFDFMGETIIIEDALVFSSMIKIDYSKNND